MLINHLFYYVEIFTENTNKKNEFVNQKTDYYVDEQKKTYEYLNEAFTNHKFIKISPIVLSIEDKKIKNENEYFNSMNFLVEGSFGSNIPNTLWKLSDKANSKYPKHIRKIHREILHNIAKKSMENIIDIVDIIIQDYKFNPKNNNLKILMNIILDQECLQQFLWDPSTNTITDIKLKDLYISHVVDEDSTENEDNFSNDSSVRYTKFNIRILHTIIKLIKEAEYILSIHLKDTVRKPSRESTIKYFFYEKFFDTTMVIDGMNSYLSNHLQVDDILINTFVFQCNINTSLKTSLDNNLRRKCGDLLIWETNRYKNIDNNFIQIEGYNGGLYQHEVNGKNIFLIINLIKNEYNQWVLQKEMFRDSLTCDNLLALSFEYCELHTNDLTNDYMILRSMNFDQLLHFIDRMINKRQDTTLIDHVSLKDKNQMKRLKEYQTLLHTLNTISIAKPKKLPTIKELKQIKNEIIKFISNLEYKQNNFNCVGVNGGWLPKDLLPILGTNEKMLNVIDINQEFENNQGADNLTSQIIISNHIMKSIRLTDIMNDTLTEKVAIKELITLIKMFENDLSQIKESQILLTIFQDLNNRNITDIISLKKTNRLKNLIISKTNRLKNLIMIYKQSHRIKLFFKTEAGKRISFLKRLNEIIKEYGIKNANQILSSLYFIELAILK